MGWTFIHNSTREQIIREQTAPFNDKDSKYNTRDTYINIICLKKCYKGASFAGTLWKVMEVTHRRKSDDSITKVERYIGCDLLRYSNYENSHAWGYKDMDESMGPTVVNCPLSYLEMVPQSDSEYAEGWRERVREHHRIRQEKLKTKRARAKGIYTPSSYFL